MQPRVVLQVWVKVSRSTFKRFTRREKEQKLILLISCFIKDDDPCQSFQRVLPLYIPLYHCEFSTLIGHSGWGHTRFTPFLLLWPTYDPSSKLIWTGEQSPHPPLLVPSSMTSLSLTSIVISRSLTLMYGPLIYILYRTKTTNLKDTQTGWTFIYRPPTVRNARNLSLKWTHKNTTFLSWIIFTKNIILRLSLHKHLIGLFNLTFDIKTHNTRTSMRTKKYMLRIPTRSTAHTHTHTHIYI